LRASQEDFLFSQAACEPAKRIFHPRKPLASQSRGFFTLASRLRAGQEDFLLSQAACEPAKSVFHSRKPLARLSGGGRPPFLERLLFISSLLFLKLGKEARGTYDKQQFTYWRPIHS